jgi:Caspase domain
LTDVHERQLVDVQITADSAGANKTAVLHLDRKQTVRMAVLFGPNPGVHLKYDVKLSGAISPDDGESQLADAGPLVADAGGKTAEVIPATTVPSKLSSPIEDVSVDSAAKVFNGPIEDKWALVVGISKYQNEKLNLKYSAKDAHDLSDYLVREANFAPDHVKLLVDDQATKEHVMEQIGDKWLPRVARPNDLVLIFISCHGSPSRLDLEGLNYLVLYNTNPNSLYATGLPLQDLASVIRERVHADRVVVIIDACHSGAANTSKGITRTGNVDSVALSQGTGQLVICSSKPDEVSWESTRYPNGVFTHQLIEALRKNSGHTKLGLAFAQLKESVLAEVLNDRKELQTPMLKSKWSGDELILSAPPTRARSGAIEEP